MRFPRHELVSSIVSWVYVRSQPMTAHQDEPRNLLLVTLYGMFQPDPNRIRNNNDDTKQIEPSWKVDSAINIKNDEFIHGGREVM